MVVPEASSVVERFPGAWDWVAKQFKPEGEGDALRGRVNGISRWGKQGRKLAQPAISRALSGSSWRDISLLAPSTKFMTEEPCPSVIPGG